MRVRRWKSNLLNSIVVSWLFSSNIDCSLLKTSWKRLNRRKTSAKKRRSKTERERIVSELLRIVNRNGLFILLLFSSHFISQDRMWKLQIYWLSRFSRPSEIWDEVDIQCSLQLSGSEIEQTKKKRKRIPDICLLSTQGNHQLFAFLTKFGTF